MQQILHGIFDVCWLIEQEDEDFSFVSLRGSATYCLYLRMEGANGDERGLYTSAGRDSQKIDPSRMAGLIDMDNSLPSGHACLLIGRFDERKKLTLHGSNAAGALQDPFCASCFRDVQFTMCVPSQVNEISKHRLYVLNWHYTTV